MKIENHSMFSKKCLDSGVRGGTASWSAELGQKRPLYPMTKEGLPDVLNGMVYNKVEIEPFEFGHGGKKYKYILLSVFKSIKLKVFDYETGEFSIHDMSKPFVMLLIDENSESHTTAQATRKLLKFNIEFEYGDKIKNIDFYNEVDSIVGPDNPWFGCDISYSIPTNVLTITIIKAPANEMYDSAPKRSKKWNEYRANMQGKIQLPDEDSTQTVFYGPPGTGKTYSTINSALAIIRGEDYLDICKKQLENPSVRKEDKQEFDVLVEEKRIRFVTFHQSYSYEDFVEGIKPVLHNSDESERSTQDGPDSAARNSVNDIAYEIVPGVFMSICHDAASDPRPYVLIIDEINRGNISKIFGELISLMESSKRSGKDEQLEVILPYSNKPFSVPANVHIIGTMNTADKSIALVDIALRRRFRFVACYPDASKIEPGMVGNVDLVKLFNTMNQRIEALKDRDHQIGHTYFMNIQDIKTLHGVFRDQIVPLLTEYFNDDLGSVAKVLGCTPERRGGKAVMIERDEIKVKTELGLSEDDFEDGIYERYRVSERLNSTTETLDEEFFISVYEKNFGTPDSSSEA